MRIALFLSLFFLTISFCYYVSAGGITEENDEYAVIDGKLKTGTANDSSKGQEENLYKEESKETDTELHQIEPIKESISITPGA